MRDVLIKGEDYFWGLTKDDFSTTCKLVKSFMSSYVASIEISVIENMTPGKEVYFSLHYREAQFLLQFGIWRLQSIFESLLKTTFDIQSRNGIWRIIKEIKKKGFTIIKETELLEWTGLRNNLSHSASEILHPCPTNLLESDMDDFSQLLLEIYEDLERQKISH